MTRDIYRELQERLDLFSIGFPPAPSGVEITILKRLFSEEDADLFLKLTPMLEPAEKIAENLGLPADEARARLADMAGRGLLFSKTKGDTTLYAATPFVHGIFEYQVNRMDKELAELMNQYGHKDMDLFKFGMMNIADETMNKYGVIELFEDSEDTIGFILSASYESISAEEVFLRGLKEIQDNIMRYLKKSVTVSIGSPVFASVTMPVTTSGS